MKEYILSSDYYFFLENPNMLITTSILATADSDRLQKGVEGLTDGAYTITLTRQTEQEISAYVTNGDSKTYSVTLTEGKAFCSCGDSMFHRKVCKHSVALALFVIRTPHATVKAEPQNGALKPFNLKLARVRRTA
jgi:uncharacterized Zn finger protein